MIKKARILQAVALLGISAPSFAVPITLDFEGVGNQAAINGFYNGGTDSQGNSGVNYGVQFGSNSLAVIDADDGGSGNFANEPTPKTIMFFLTGSAILNYAAGFDTGFSFFYTSSGAASVNVYDGLGATGNLLGSINLVRNIDGCAGDPTGGFCRFSIGAVAFAGIGRSIDFGGTVNQVGYDNITFGSTDPNSTQVPEPATLALFGLGLMGAGLARRRRKA